MDKDKILELHNSTVLLLGKSVEEGTIPDPDMADIWVINHDSPTPIKEFLAKTIRSRDPRVYLKPIFLQREFEKSYQMAREHLYIEELSDGFIENLQIMEKISLMERVNYFISRYVQNRNLDGQSEDDVIMQSTFDYTYTRQAPIAPIRSHNSLSGYAYPRLEAYFQNPDKYARILLQKYYYEGILDRGYIDTTHLCHQCSGGFLNYREICPKCKSHNLIMRPLIHHFRCAYIGPKDDFVYNDKLVCPKCSSELRNLGVDYDNPGFTFICNTKSCRNQFQRPPVLVSCVHCHSDQYPHELVACKIYEYTFTEKGLKRFLFNEL